MKKVKILVKAQEDASPDYGCIPEERPIEMYIKKGVIILDKPPGPTSHEVVSWVKKILNLNRAGHGGTLDPRVTGVLPVLLESSTKAGEIIVSDKKEYVCLMKLHDSISPKEITDVCNQFVGKIYQRPPLKSAVKRRLRIREIYYLNILEIDKKDVLIKVGCEAGTYIRKLVFDMGEVLGCGAHMSQLRRTRSGSFFEGEILVTLHDIKDAYTIFKENGDETELRKIIIPLERVLKGLPRIIVKDSAIDAICHGAGLMAPGILSLDENVTTGKETAIFTLKGEVVAVGEAKMDACDIIKAESGIVVDTKKVFMQPGVYPKGWRSKTV